MCRVAQDGGYGSFQRRMWLRHRASSWSRAVDPVLVHLLRGFVRQQTVTLTPTVLVLCPGRRPWVAVVHLLRGFVRQRTVTLTPTVLVLCPGRRGRG